MKAFYRNLFFVLAIFAIVPFFVHAAPTLSETLDAVKNKYTFNDQINVVVTDGETLYLGGSFSSVSEPIGEAGLFDLVGGDFVDFPKVQTLLGDGDTVYSSASDGNGGWYLGGSFDTVLGDEHFALVHILSDGTLNEDFNPVFLQNASITALTLSSDGGVLYVGGSFVQVNGVSRSGFVALDTSDGSVLSPDLDISDVRSFALSSDGLVLYIGGQFSEIDATTRNNLGAIDTSDYSLLPFDPDVLSAVTTLVLSSDDTTLYAGGGFTDVNNGTTRNRVAAFDTTTGIATAFDPNVEGGFVAHLLLSSDDSLLYVGGAFETVNGGTTRNKLASFDTSDATVTAFNPNINETVNSIALTSDELTLYAGGLFTTVNGATSRKRLAALDAGTGTATAEDFAGGVSTQISTIALDGTNLFFGGQDMSIHQVTRNEVAAIDLTTYELTDFDPNIVSVDFSVHALALSPDFETLYIGGSFNGINGIGGNRYSLAAVTTVDGIMTDFNPNMPSATVYSLAVSSDGSTVYAGGDFLDWGASEVDYLAKMDSGTGAQLAFAPSLDGTVHALTLSTDGASLYTAGEFTERVASLDAGDGSTLLQTELPANDAVYALALSSDGATLYAGGTFTEFSSSDDIGEGAPFDTVTSLVDETFPVISTDGGGGGGGGATVYEALPDGSGGWYVGGSFTHVGATEQPALAHILSDGTLDTDFLPVLDQLTTNQIYALALDGTTLYVGGEFGEINGTPRNNLAALDTTDGSLIAGFDPDVNGYVSDIVLSSDGSVLYAGGGFIEVNTGSTPVAVTYLAGFTTADGVVTAFDAVIDGGVNTLELSSDDTVLYAGGTFGFVNGATARNNLAAFTTADSVATAFDADVNDAVYSMVLSLDDEILYAGGLFDEVNGVQTGRPYLAAFDGTTGVTADFNPLLDQIVYEPVLDGFVNDVSISSDGDTLYIGGGFSEINGVSRNKVAGVSISGGGSLTSFYPSAETSEVFIREIEFSDDGGIFLGGEPMYITDSVARDHLAAIDTLDFSLTDFDPGPISAIESLALSSDDGLLYAGGNTLLYTYNTTTGSETSFSPVVAGTVYSLALSSAGDELYSGGDFTNKYAIYSEDLSGGGGDDEEEEEEGDSGGDSSRGSSSKRRPQDGINIFVVLMNRIRELLLQLIAQGGTVPPEMMKYLAPVADTTTPAGYTRDLDLNSEGPDVTKLQAFLIQQNKGPQAQALAQVGATGFFGPLTQSALAEYQASVGITPASGYFGPITRAYLISIGAW